MRLHFSLRACRRSAAVGKTERKSLNRGGGRSCGKCLSADRQRRVRLLQPIAGSAPHIKRTLRSLFGVLVLAAGGVGLNGCDSWNLPFQATKTTETLVIASISSPLAEFEVDLVQDFVSSSGRVLKVIPVSGPEEGVQLLSSGKAELLLGRIASELAGELGVLSSPVYSQSELIELCPSAKLYKQNRVVLALRKDLSRLQERKLNRSGLVSMTVFEGSPPRELIRRSLGRKNTCILLEKLESLSHLRMLKDFRAQQTVVAEHDVSFLLGRQSRNLQTELRMWFQNASRNQRVSAIQSRHTSHLYELSFSDVVTFDRVLGQRFSTYEKQIKSIAKSQKIPWQLLAAVAFQESQLLVDARSFTGVQGIMQLTRATADQMGVADRLNPEQSLLGGAKYLRMLLNLQPGHLHPRERLMLALASYNVGYGHLQDAQKLAIERGKNPHSWHVLKTMLPLLTEPSVAQRLRFGVARGFEPVDFVHRVLAYYDFLSS